MRGGNLVGLPDLGTCILFSGVGILQLGTHPLARAFIVQVWNMAWCYASLYIAELQPEFPHGNRLNTDCPNQEPKNKLNGYSYTIGGM